MSFTLDTKYIHILPVTSFFFLVPFCFSFRSAERNALAWNNLKIFAREYMSKLHTTTNVFYVLSRLFHIQHYTCDPCSFVFAYLFRSTLWSLEQRVGIVLFDSPYNVCFSRVSSFCIGHIHHVYSHFNEK